jgi:hypothetical protein
LAVERLEAEHGRGIHLMKVAMDEVTFERGGSEVHMRKGSARNPGTELRSVSETANGGPSNDVQRCGALAETLPDAGGMAER